MADQQSDLAGGDIALQPAVRRQQARSVASSRSWVVRISSVSGGRLMAVRARLGTGMAWAYGLGAPIRCPFGDPPAAARAGPSLSYSTRKAVS